MYIVINVFQPFMQSCFMNMFSGPSSNNSDDEPFIKVAKHPQVTKVVKIILKRCDGEETGSRSLDQTTAGTDYKTTSRLTLQRRHIHVHTIVTLQRRRTVCWKVLKKEVRGLRGIIRRRIGRWSEVSYTFYWYISFSLLDIPATQWLQVHELTSKVLLVHLTDASYLSHVWCW